MLKTLTNSRPTSLTTLLITKIVFFYQNDVTATEEKLR